MIKVERVHPELQDIEMRLQELETQGYTVFPGFLDHTTTAAVRAHIDSLAGPVGPDDRGRPKHVLRHPIPGAIMARLASNPATLELAALSIGSRDLRLREQVLIRSDPEPPPYDSPGSHKLSLGVSDEGERERGEHPIPSFTAAVSGVSEGDGIEICANEGDLIVFNPLCHHAASPNRTDRPRYVYFSSFYHPSAQRLIELMRRTAYRDNFPDSLRRGLPPRLQALLD